MLDADKLGEIVQTMLEIDADSKKLPEKSTEKDPRDGILVRRMDAEQKLSELLGTDESNWEFFRDRFPKAAAIHDQTIGGTTRLLRSIFRES